MNYSEKWGKDVDEAVRLALEDLGATEDQIKVTVIEEPSKGFLGLGAKLAKVRVELIADEEPVKEKTNGNKKKDRQNKPDENRHKRDLRKKDRQPGAQSNKSGSGHGRSDSGSGRKDSGYGRKDRPQKKERKPYEEKYPEIDLGSKPNLSKRPDDLVAAADSIAAEFINSMVEKMGINVEVESFKNADCYYIEISGKDSRTVIGKRGQTLDSIQYLTNLVVNKDRDEYLRTIIDVEGYRSRREKTLEQLGAKLARKVQKTGRSVKLEPMNPYERKVIHSTLQGIEGITTRSEGEEPYRRVIVEKKN